MIPASPAISATFRDVYKRQVLECACSMVITDPKSEILRKTGNLLKQKGYEVLVLDLINPNTSFCYNPFVYVHDDRDVLTLSLIHI